VADDAAGAVRRTPRPVEDSCRAYEVDGEIVRVAGGKPLDEAGQAALGEIVRAASAKVAAEHPNLGVVQELIMAGLAANRAIHDGEVRGGCTVQDGAKVKARLKAAISAAREALDAQAQVREIVRAKNDDVVEKVDAALGHRYHRPGVHFSIPRIAEKAAADLELALWLHAELQHKLTRPCGECHPCTNWADETWRRAGRKPPAVVTWEDKLAETRGLYARLDDAIKLIEEMSDHIRQDPALAIGVETRLAALQGDQPTERKPCKYVVSAWAGQPGSECIAFAEPGADYCKPHGDALQRLALQQVAEPTGEADRG